MEHRYNRRIAIQSRLLIHVSQSAFVRGVAKNISTGGLALEAVNSPHLKKNLVVRVAFMANGRLVILPSQVVRVGKDEVALMFTEEMSPRRQILKDWLDDAIRACPTRSAAEVKQHKNFSVPPAT